MFGINKVVPFEVIVENNRGRVRTRTISGSNIELNINQFKSIDKKFFITDTISIQLLKKKNTEPITLIVISNINKLFYTFETILDLKITLEDFIEEEVISFDKIELFGNGSTIIVCEKDPIIIFQKKMKMISTPYFLVEKTFKKIIQFL
jgi:hypothetical protein